LRRQHAGNLPHAENWQHPLLSVVDNLQHRRARVKLGSFSQVVSGIIFLYAPSGLGVRSAYNLHCRSGERALTSVDFLFPPRTMPLLSRATVTFLMPCLAVCGGWWVTLAASQGASYTDQAASIPWVRTNDGWEKAYWLAERQTSFETPIHPAIVAGVLIVAAAMILATADHRQQKAATRNVASAFIIAPGDRL
jgi:hypothetical protein